MLNADMMGRREYYTYGSTVRYQCHTGTLNGPNEIWCTEHGKWSALPSKCEGSDTRSDIALRIFYIQLYFPLTLN